MKLDVVVPIEVTRGLNAREHHFTRSKRVKAEREAVSVALRGHDGAVAFCDWAECVARSGDFGARVTLLRPFARTPLDSDNLSGAFKGVRDEVASFLGVDDKSERVHWRYVQCRPQKPICYVGNCRSATQKVKHGSCPACKTAEASKLHVRIRIEIVPASDVDPLLTAVRVLRQGIETHLRNLEAFGKTNESALYDALATADALATFDPKEMYR